MPGRVFVTLDGSLMDGVRQRLSSYLLGLILLQTLLTSIHHGLLCLIKRSRFMGRDIRFAIDPIHLSFVRVLISAACQCKARESIPHWTVR
jgi:hypothetical protein